MTSVKLFYSQRLGDYQEVEPTLNMIVLVLPFIILQIIGPIFTLVFLTAYFKAFVAVFVLFLILTQFIIIYSIKNKETFYFSNYSSNKLESNFIFITAFLTSWISPCSVWRNMFVERLKLNFLMISSSTTIITYLFSLTCIYFFTSLDLIPVMGLFPITHCVGNQANYSILENVNLVELSFSNLNIILNSNRSTFIIQRLCSENENPTDFYYYYMGPLGFLLLFVSFLASIVLQYLGNYYTMFQCSKMISCCTPILNDNLIQELLLFAPKEISHKVIIKSLILNFKSTQKQIFKRSSLIDTVEGLLKTEITRSQDEDIKTKYRELLCKMQNTDGLYSVAWEEEPIEKAIRDDKILQACLLYGLGGLLLEPLICIAAESGATKCLNFLIRKS